MANSPSGESVVSRVARILDAFDTRRTTLTVSELSRRVGLAQSTTHRLVADLTLEGMLERDASGHIRLGRRLWELASRGSHTVSLSTVALPFMEDVHSIVREHTSLSVLDANEVLYIHRLSSHSTTTNIAEVASRLPLHACSSGLIMLAYADDQLRNRVLNRPLQRFTDQTITDPNELRRLLTEIYRVGYASVPGVIVPESTGIAVPVFERGHKLVAALSVIVHRGQEQLPSTVPALRTAARGISRAMGDEGPRPYRIPTHPLPSDNN
ncbi:IclR family transcriptional regulator [Lysinibacter cavernae]|uniref:DNA-binding IclR family transcriptional regulator n=1 Tax=Lysinibacter cavernae TaxID=1640652 RepID=A0A7X5R264_9MICO|nr:IclR family transcriptional regulator [Lysinibacter cavernae]NIH54176.1 DNA-binding IclR family transcriptional regulator [Lysinibacter cavernae]